MTFTQRFIEAANQTLYAFPLDAALSTWATNRVLCTGGTEGAYSVTVDDATYTDWAVFIGATAPATFDNAVVAFDATSTTVSVLPFTGTTPDRTSGTTITVFVGEAASVSVGLTGASLDALTLRFAVEGKSRTDVVVIENGDISRSGSTFTVTIPSSITSKVARYKWSLRNVTASANLVLGQGVLEIAYAADKDA